MRCLYCSNEIPELVDVCPFCKAPVKSQSPVVNPNQINNNPVDNNIINREVVITKTPVQQTVPINNQSVDLIIVPDTQAKKANDKSERFFIIVIIVGLMVLIAIIIYMFLKPENKESDIPYSQTTTTSVTTTEVASKNVGIRSSYSFALQVGQVALASIHDATSNTYSEVDVTGIRFIDTKEASELAATYVNENLIDGFVWNGFEYSVKFNDLTYLNNRSISPVLDAKFYNWDARDYVVYNSITYIIKAHSIYTGTNIKNNESATIKVVYQLPVGEDDYSICVGKVDKNQGCFNT